MMDWLHANENLTGWDLLVVAFYLVFMAAIGFVFRHFNKDSSDYFRGGGAMLWWMVGATAFMTQFSAWTFTGAAGKAYTDGIIIAAIFVGNALGYFVNAMWSAPLFRQTRVVTAIEVVRDRFGRTSEQALTWFDLPMRLLYAGIWLNALAVFVMAIFGLEDTVTIWAVGLVVLAMAVTGGSWAVVASDFMQLLVLMTVSIVLCVTSLAAVGGIGPLLEGLPDAHFTGGESAGPRLAVLLVLAYLVAQVIKINSMLDSHRYLAAKDGREARKGAWLAGILMLVGPIVWFVPPLCARVLYPDIAGEFAGIDSDTKAADASLILMGLRTLPVGMVGVLLCGVFAATMSSMDSGLNRNAGIFVKNFYVPFLRRDSGEGEQLVVGKVMSLVFGLMVIGVAQWLKALEDLSLFDIMVWVGAGIGVPLAIPLVLGLLIKRTPSWSCWSTALVGLGVVVILGGLPKGLGGDGWYRGIDLVGLGWATESTAKDTAFVLTVALVTIIGSLWFVGTTFFYSAEREAGKARIEAFHARAAKPVDYDREIGKPLDLKQLHTLGWLCYIYGGFLALLVVIPQDGFMPRLAYIFCGGFLGVVGWFLHAQARRNRAASAAATLQGKAASDEA